MWLEKRLDLISVKLMVFASPNGPVRITLVDFSGYESLLSVEVRCRVLQNKHAVLFVEVLKFVFPVAGVKILYARGILGSCQLRSDIWGWLLDFRTASQVFLYSDN